LVVEGFKIIGDPLDIRFPEEGRIAIVGPNETGKSTILEAIDYALYGLRAGEPRTDLITWGKKEARLRLEFSCGGQRYTLQRTITESTHRARLTPWSDDEEDEANAVTSIREIQARIEEITGMDRDAFEKLVYVRQKDLDALRDLYRAGRAQFLNRVMGIEVFDTSAKRVKEDLSGLDSELKSKNSELNALRASHEQYGVKLEESRALASEIPRLSGEVERLEGEVEQANNVLVSLEWHRDYEATQDILRSLKAQLENVRKNRSEHVRLSKQSRDCRAALDRYGPEITRLQEARETLRSQEAKLEEARAELARITEELNQTTQRAGVTGVESFELEAVPKARHRQLLYALLSLAAAFGLIVAGLIVNRILSIIGLATLSLVAYFFYVYSKLDRFLTKSSEILSLLRRREEQESKFCGLEETLATIVKQTGYPSAEEAEKELNEIIGRMRSETGQDSVQALKALLDITRERVEQLQSSVIEGEPEKLEEEMQAKQNELEVKLAQKPLGAEAIEYTPDRYVAAKEKAASLNKRYMESKTELEKKRTLAEQIGRDLAQLKIQHDRYEALEIEIRCLEAQTSTLREVIDHFGETSRELRAIVLPHARFLINQMLPLMTDGRYSDFQISEDLRFTVLSSEAGEYKERELFSGGTQDQFLIALRLAFTQSILDSRLIADKYCLLLDECIASSDETRRQGIFEVLGAARSVFTQILIVAHEDISDYTDYHVVLGRDGAGHTVIRSKNW
jgi:exonuclease SbcC